jgi:hypothetical protein
MRAARNASGKSAHTRGGGIVLGANSFENGYFRRFFQAWPRKFQRSRIPPLGETTMCAIIASIRKFWTKKPTIPSLHAGAVQPYCAFNLRNHRMPACSPRIDYNVPTFIRRGIKLSLANDQD